MSRRGRLPRRAWEPLSAARTAQECSLRPDARSESPCAVDGKHAAAEATWRAADGAAGLLCREGCERADAQGAWAAWDCTVSDLILPSEDIIYGVEHAGGPPRRAPDAQNPSTADCWNPANTTPDRTRTQRPAAFYASHTAQRCSLEPRAARTRGAKTRGETHFFTQYRLHERGASARGR